LLASGSCSQFHSVGNCVTGEIIIWDVGTRRAVTTFLDTTGAPQAIAFSPDGTLLALNDCVLVEATSTCLEGAVLLWEIGSGASPKKLIGHLGYIWDIAFSPDGETLASGSADNSIILWDLETGQPIGQRMSNHGGPVRTLAFSPNGNLLASGGFDNAIYLWDVETGQALGGPLAVHSATVQDVVFSPDGSTLASSGLDGNIIFWDVDINSWRTRACDIANRNLRQAEWQRFLSDAGFRETCTEIR